MCALALSLLVGAAFAQAPEADRPRNPAEGLRRADTNKDGKISFDELKAARPEATQERFNMLDTNKDGFIGAEDRAAGARGKAATPTSDDSEARRKLMDSLVATDANADGKASFEEVSMAKPGFAKADFDRVDRDKDGFITAADTPKAPTPADRPKAPAARAGKASKVTPEQREALRARIVKADVDGDGYVTHEEAKVGLPNVTEARFAALDRNGDGKLGPEDRVDR
jgi:hypothetical protein